MQHTLFYLIIFFIVFEFCFSKILGYLNHRNWGKGIPDELKDLYTTAQFDNAKNYARANYQLGLISGSLNFVLILTLFYFNAFARLDSFLRSYMQNEILLTLFYFGLLYLASAVVQFPFGIYSTFVIEEKYGFNKTTIATFIMDKIKVAVLSVVVGGGLLALITFFYLLSPANFWWMALLAVSAFTIFFAMFNTSLILPLFNKLTPLPDGEVKNAIEAYTNRISFPLKNLYLIDGSRRSAKANAFFSGMFGKKSIVLFDTLLHEHSTDEITAIVAHETGHFKKKHVLQMMLISLFQFAVILFLFGKISTYEGLADVFNASQNSFHLSLIVFSFLYTPVSTITGILMNVFSRKNEYEADAYAKDTFSATPLLASLKKLSTTNLTNLNPHPWYVFIYYSHPPLLHRMRALLS